MFRQPSDVPEYVSAVGLNSSHVNLTSEVPAADVSECTSAVGVIPREQKVYKLQKKTKYDEVTQCLICEKTAKRIDKHYIRAHPELTEKDLRNLKDFMRTRGRHENAKIFYCEEHDRRFPNRMDHKRHYKCDLNSISVVANHTIKR